MLGILHDGVIQAPHGLEVFLFLFLHGCDLDLKSLHFVVGGVIVGFTEGTLAQDFPAWLEHIGGGAVGLSWWQRWQRILLHLKLISRSKDRYL